MLLHSANALLIDTKSSDDDPWVSLRSHWNLLSRVLRPLFFGLLLLFEPAARLQRFDALGFSPLPDLVAVAPGE